jgi:hypothetical protein
VMVLIMIVMGIVTMMEMMMVNMMIIMMMIMAVMCIDRSCRAVYVSHARCLSGNPCDCCGPQQRVCR